MAHRQPENGFAQIYLAYTLYDLGKFKGSLKALRRISKNYFAKRRQRWRDLERQQLAICCLLRLGKTRHLPAQLADLFARTARAKPVDCPQPEALAATLHGWLAARTVAQTKYKYGSLKTLNPLLITSKGLNLSTPRGNRTPVTAVKGRCPNR